MPMFDLRDAAGVMAELNACRKAFSDRYIKVNAFDSLRGWEMTAAVLHRQRPKDEPGSRSTAGSARPHIRYTTRPTRGKPEGERYTYGIARAWSAGHAGSGRRADAA